MSAGKLQPGLVLWFHGLGDSGNGWRHLARDLEPRLPWLRWSFPDAPEQRVTCNGGARMPSWFDLRVIPVMHGEKHDGMDAAVARVHALVADAKREGLPASRIVVGGFSQGGALSLHAGVTCQDELAGICSLSGWVARSTASVSQPKTRILMCHGTADRVVPFPVGRRSAELIGRECSNVSFKDYAGLEHSSSPAEIAAVEAFLLSVLPPLPCDLPLPRQPSRAAPVATTIPTHRCSLREDGLCRVEIDIPTLEGVLLDVSASEVRLSGRFCLTVSWPASVDTVRSKARFDRRRSMLVVKAPRDALT
eukprot:TRINITY_DN42454_c0_g1_i1.p1 TRINITY_DN42454_c0_g1~~TRINITY_DN42454_c0_g1_i1.p1  ORF type:complete len:307 (+),score=36.47 TRINITY_DN42454_c0_g1_i1:73-993(+)